MSRLNNIGQRRHDAAGKKVAAAAAKKRNTMSLKKRLLMYVYECFRWAFGALRERLVSLPLVYKDGGWYSVSKNCIDSSQVAADRGSRYCFVCYHRSK